MRIFRIGVIGLLLLMSFTTDSFARRDGNLYNELSRASVTKVYVASPVNNSDLKAVDTEDLKKQLEAALTGRRSINFEVVKSASQADIQIDCAVTDYFWSETDPVDMFMGTGPLIMDAALNEHYAQMKADWSITDLSKKRVIWKDDLRASETDGTMMEADSFTRVNAKMVKVFIRQAFSRKRS